MLPERSVPLSCLLSNQHVFGAKHLVSLPNGYAEMFSLCCAVLLQRGRGRINTSFRGDIPLQLLSKSRA